VLVYIPCIVLALLGYVPFRATGAGFVAHVVPLVLATEAWLMAINRPYNDRRRRQRHPIRELWRVRIIWSGLAPVFMKASLQAILGGPNRKPIYKVTRKYSGRSCCCRSCIGAACTWPCSRVSWRAAGTG